MIPSVQAPLLFSTSKSRISLLQKRDMLLTINSTVFNIMKDTGVNYIAFMGWIGL